MRATYSLEHPYILTVSRLVPHKNVEGLIRAYTLARERVGTSDVPTLVIVGGRGGGEQEVYREANRSPYRKDIMFIDYVAAEDLNAVYAGADLFVFPSLNEGWGMPVIEAFASGTPVVATNLTAVPEAAGSAALLVDPRDERVLAESIVKVLRDKSLREQMIRKGLARAKEFTWRRSARETVAAYERVLAYTKHA